MFYLDIPAVELDVKLFVSENLMDVTLTIVFHLSCFNLFFFFFFCFAGVEHVRSTNRERTVVAVALFSLNFVLSAYS